MLTKLIRRMNEHRENFNKKVGNIKKNQLELQNPIMDMKNTAEWVDSGLDDSEKEAQLTQPTCHSCWARAQESRSPNYSVHTLQPRTPSYPRACAAQPETPLQGEASVRS